MHMGSEDSRSSTGAPEQLWAQVADYKHTRALLQWAAARGAWISDKVELRTSGISGRGFFARSEIAQGEDVLRLPVSPDFILTQASVRQDTIVGPVIRKWEESSDSQLDVEEVLALYLAGGLGEGGQREKMIIPIMSMSMYTSCKHDDELRWQLNG